jgi:hypothetical protein
VADLNYQKVLWTVSLARIGRHHKTTTVAQHVVEEAARDNVRSGAPEVDTQHVVAIMFAARAASMNAGLTTLTVDNCECREMARLWLL